MKTLLILMLGASPAWSHSAPTGWAYDPSCCSTVDCRQVPTSSISERPDGYHILATKEVIPYSDPRIRNSEDEFYHLCTVMGADHSRVLCLYRILKGF